MLFGTFIGAAADKLGRKRLCQVYCVLYLFSCVTKHARDYWILMLGRVLGGIATSLLFSSFESWMVCEHNARGYDSSALNDTFSLMYAGNSLCAILAGMMAEAVADLQPLTPFAGVWHFGGYCSPFDLSAAFLILGFCLICATWSENYGRGGEASSGCSDVAAPLAQMKGDPSIVMIGGIVSLFEGSMYIFVLSWTPALSSSSSTAPPFGLIFATFMVVCMGGSSLFSILSASMPCERILSYVFLVAAAALSLPLAAGGSTVAVLSSLLLFEACVGIYWPAIGTVKAVIVPEETRATVYNIYRMPLNALVLGVLLNHMSTFTAFSCCAAMLLLALFLQRLLVQRIAMRAKRMGGAARAYEEGGKMESAKTGLMSDAY